jgi:transcription initiation factor TFIIIB Brf1 subunit/transcription initiation factor TFIIB
MFNKYPELLKKHTDLAKMFDNVDFDVSNTSKVNNYNKIHKCECGSDKLIEDHALGVLMCQNCGQSLEEILDDNPEWKNYDDSDITNARCSAMNPLLPKSSLSTSIGGIGGNWMKTIQRWDSMPYKERSLNNELKKIREICNKMNVTKCIEDDAKIMYKMASDAKHKEGPNAGKYVITRGKNRIGISAACIHIACEKKGTTYTAKEIAEYFGITYAEINKGLKKLRNLINLKQTLHNEFGTPNQFIKRYCNNLKMLNAYSDEAINISSNIEKLNIATEHNPYSIAAACILLIAELHKLKHITKKKLAAEFGISDVTINKTYKKIESYIDIIFDANKVEKIYKENEMISKEDDVIPDEIKERMKLFGIIVPEKENDLNIEEDYQKILNLEKKMNEKRINLINLEKDLSFVKRRVVVRVRN